MVNPEWWEDGWNEYLFRTDFLIFKCEADKTTFYSTRYVPANVQSFVIPWTTPVKPSDFAKFPSSTNPADGFLWLLGASRNKRAAATALLPLWKAEWPPLKVYSTTALDLSGALSPNVSVTVEDLPETTRRNLQAFYPGHLIFSATESLGLQAHEGQAAGAFLLGNQLPTYVEAFKDDAFVSLLPADLKPFKATQKDSFSSLTQESLQDAIQIFLSSDLASVRKVQKEAAGLRFLAFQKTAWSAYSAMEAFEPRFPIKTLPPVLPDNECPPISIVTLLHNRRKFVDLAIHNLLLTDYPKNKIEWVVVEDSDKVDEQASDKIMKFGREAAPLSVSYIPLQKPVSIGEKRNLACKRAQHDIILMMDDDDHYPPSSFRRRVAWLTKNKWNSECVTCTTIACYDLLQGTSAVNTPPWTLGLNERVSEATLSFTRAFWERQPFPTVSMSEGDGFLTGRISEVLELQPQQIIVAMSHGTNASSRRIPPGPSGKPSCFWGFPKEFLAFLHGLVGVAVE